MLDPGLVGEALAAMRELSKQGVTMVVVTHEISFACEAVDRVAFMGGGHIVEEGKSEQALEHPEHERTRAFLSNFF